MSKKYDTIIIGGGHNGLTAAAFLAQKGKKVAVVERRSVVGGVAAGEEFESGYHTNGLLHDTGAVRSAAIKKLGLVKHGLELTGKRASVALLGKEGQCIVVSDDAKQTAVNIKAHSERDAHAYMEYRGFIDKIRPLISDLMNQAPPDLVKMGTGDLWFLAKKALGLKRLGKTTMMEFLKVAPMSVQDFLDERFETEFLKAGLAGPAVYGSFTSPRSAYTTLNLLIWECLSENEVVGGPQALVDALGQACKALGVEIILDAEVEQIMVDSDRAVTGVKLADGSEINANHVAASCSPHETFLNLLEPNLIEFSLEHGINHFRSRGTTAKLNLALNKPLTFNGLESEVSFLRTGSSWLEMEKAFDPIKYKEFSPEPILDIDLSGSAPEKHMSVSILVHYVPFELKEGWNEKSRKDLENSIVATLEQYCADFKDTIVASELLTPVDLAQRYGLPNGHIFHGEHAVDQLITRPLPNLMRYQTHIKGLTLCGSGSHPGGGITCAPGMLGV